MASTIVPSRACRRQVSLWQIWTSVFGMETRAKYGHTPYAFGQDCSRVCPTVNWTYIIPYLHICQEVRISQRRTAQSGCTSSWPQMLALLIMDIAPVCCVLTVWGWQSGKYSKHNRLSPDKTVWRWQLVLRRPTHTMRCAQASRAHPTRLEHHAPYSAWCHVGVRIAQPHASPGCVCLK